MKTFWAIILLLVFSMTMLYAGTHPLLFEKIKFPNNLSVGNISTIVQDRQGFLWIGSTEGLFRYDGYTFKPFRHDPENVNSLCCNWVNPSSMDAQGNLWIATGCNGFDYFDITTEQFTHHYYNSSQSNGVPSENIQSIFVDRGGIVWLATDHGLSLYHPDSDRYENYHHDPGDTLSLASENVSIVFEDSKGNMWIGFYGGGLDRFNKQNRTFKHYKTDTFDTRSLSNETVIHVFEDHTNILWIATEGGLNKFDYETETFQQYKNDPHNENSLSSNTIHWINEDSDGNLLITTAGGGLNVFNRERTSWMRFLQNPADQRSISDNNLAAVSIDKSGNIWVGSRNGTLDKCSPLLVKFDLVQYNDVSSQKFQFNIIWEFLEDTQHRIWVGTQNGIIVHDSLWNIVNRYTYNPNVQGSLMFPTVRALFEDRKGRIWVGTAQGPEIFNPKSKTFIPVFRRKHSDFETDDAVAQFYQDKSGTMWIGNQNNDVITIAEDMIDDWLAHRQSDNELKVNRYPLPSFSIDSTVVNGARSFCEDRSDILWLGTVEGLVKIHTKTMNFETVLIDPTSTDRLANNRILVISQDSVDEDVLWLGTFLGLVRYTKSTGTIRRYTERDGLSNNLIYGIVPDSAGNLWLSTNSGISRFNKAAERFRNFSLDEGLQGQEYNRGAYYKLRSGIILLGGMKGFNYFMPTEIKDNYHTPEIVLTNFTVHDKPYGLRYAISYMKEIFLDWKDNHFAFEYAALESTNPALNQYAYKLVGYDKDWINAGTRRFESYTNLDPGSYVFRVVGCNNEQVWNSIGCSVTIHIRTPFWMTWWFRGIVLVTIAFSVTWIVRIRIRRYQELERLRLRIAQDLHDELGSNLSSIALISDIVRTRFSVNDQAYAQLTDSGTVARKMTEVIRDVVWFINPEKDSLEEISLKMKSVALVLLQGKKHRLQFDVGNPNLELTLEQKRNLFLFYKEALNNIVRHSGATQIEILFTTKERMLELVIIDNGIGFDPSLVSTGNGIKNLHKRAHALKATLVLESKKGKGTTIRLSLNIPRTWYGIK